MTDTVLTAPHPSSPNDVNLEAIGELSTTIIDDPARAATTWAASVRWRGGFRSEATIREFDPLPSDEPEALGGTDSAPNPVEQLLAALGNCLVVGYVANASAAGITVANLRVEIDGDLDLHTFLGLGGDHAGFGAVRVVVHIDSDADPEALRQLHDKVTSTSPVGHTLAHTVPVDFALI